MFPAGSRLQTEDSALTAESLKEVEQGLWCRIVTEQAGGWFTINYYRKDSPFPSLEVPPPPRPPARFAMPAARGKTSLNARDGEKERSCLFKCYTDLE